MATPKLRWSASSGRFIRADGRFVPESVVRAELDRSLLQSQNRVRILGDDLRSGRLSLEGWRVQMKQEIKNSHLRGAALARGGWERMGPANFGRAGQIVREEYQHLEAWVGSIRDGAPLDGRLTTRSNLYVQAGRGTFHKVQEQEMLKLGKDLELSVLHPADHCDQCIAEADAGFRPIGQMIPIGERTCGRNCKCTVQYRSSANGQVAGNTDSEILARPASSYPLARPGERETLNAFTTSGGQLAPKRQQLHDAIVRQHFQGARPVAEPTVYVMGGGPASGKSVMLDKLNTPGNTVTVDPDHIKTLLPEFRDGTARGDTNAATMVHEESSALAKRIVAEAARGRYRIVVDGTGDNSYENLTRKVEGYRAGGGKIVANYVTVDTETAVARAHDRGIRTGRFVPETYIREIHRNISDIIPRAIEDGLFDELTVWDNNGAAGSAKVIARYTGGQLTVLDEFLWQRFLAKVL